MVITAELWFQFCCWLCRFQMRDERQWMC